MTVTRSKRTQRSSSRGPTLARRIWRVFKVLTLVSVVLMLIGAGVLFGLYREYVVTSPGNHIRRDDILGRISRESPVFYDDGLHKLGVFFGAEHRQYVKYDELPPFYVQSIVASEDKNFFSHPGVDFRGIARAMVANIKAGRVVAGGSTITQQTAKNLFYRSDRSFSAKWDELVDALRLEAHFSKKEILEFYVNQFHVHSNGRGLGIAARYFFSKDVKDLTSLECAFLAGVVKGPSNYNPFIGNTEEQRERAKARALARTHYVLERLYQDGKLTKAELDKLKQEPLNFNKGEFRFDQNVILDHVFDLLREEPFASLLAENGIDNPEVSGIRVFTTVNKTFQEVAEYGLRHNLTQMGLLLENLGLDAFFAPETTLFPLEKDELHEYGFYRGKVKSAVLTGKGAPSLEVDLGGITGSLDAEALARVASLLEQAKAKNTWKKAGKAEVAALAEAIPVGTPVHVSVRRIESDGLVKLDLEATTELQGAVVILDQGRIRAMVGGQDNQNFNRVTSARRQLGSTFKPLTFAAALSLGWGVLSPLENRRIGFPFQKTWYWPRADHDPVGPYVSMVKAGATSENLASVYLLYHLTDRLNDDQLIDLARRVGMAPKVLELQAEYAMRIRDEFGIIPTEESFKEALFYQVRNELKVDLALSRPRELQAIEALEYGLGYDAQANEVGKIKDVAERKELMAFLDRAFLRLETLSPEALKAAEAVLRTVPEAPSPEGAPRGAEGQALRSLDHFYVAETAGEKRLIYSKNGSTAWKKATPAEVRELLQGQPVAPPALEEPPPASETSLEVPPPVPMDEANAQELDAKKSPRGGLLSRFRRQDEEPSVEGAGETRVGERESEPARGGRNVTERGADRRGAERVPDASSGGELGRTHPEPADLILLEDTVSPATLTALREALDQRIANTPMPERYDLSRLIWEREFKVMLGIQYVIAMARAMGVKSPLQPVLPFTLGASEITLLEAAQIYQTFLQGKAYGFDQVDEEAGIAESAIIARIEDPNGKVLYALEQREHELLAQSVAASVGRILRSVVEQGTGERASSAILVGSMNPKRNRALEADGYIVPIFGKTGTTNNYANAAFVGFVPNPVAIGPDFPYGQALTVATYIGYDRNRPMKRGNIRAQGSNAALPPWIDTARGVVRALELAGKVNPESLVPKKLVPIGWPPEMAAVAVDLKTGLALDNVVLLPEEVLPEGARALEVVGQPEGSVWRERENYLPFLPFGEKAASAAPVRSVASGAAPTPQPGAPVEEQR